MPSASCLLGGVLSPWRRGVCWLPSHCVRPSGHKPARGHQVLTPPPPAGPRCSPTPHLSPRARACLASWGHSPRPPCPRRWKERSQAGETPIPTETVHRALHPSPKECVFPARPGSFIDIYVDPSQPFLVTTGTAPHPGTAEARAHVCPRHRPTLPSSLCPLHLVWCIFVPTLLILTGILQRARRSTPRMACAQPHPSTPTPACPCSSRQPVQPLLIPLHRHGD